MSDAGGPASLDALLTPQSIAVIGGSDNPARIGGRPIRYLKEAGYAGRIYPVNPKHARVQGIEAFAAIDDVPGDVDLAIVAVPAVSVPETLERCAGKGVRSAVIFSAGFAEMDDDGRIAQEAITALARRSGMRILGPNCLGVYNTEIGFFGTFSTTLENGLPRSGPVGLVSQSGAYGSHLSLLATQRRIGIRYWVTTGNEADVNVPECVAWFAERSDVEVIVAYAEGITDPNRLIAALDRARANRKPVIVMKVGTTEVGAAAARSHTASLAGADAVYDALFRQFGAFRARNTEEMLDIAYAAGFGTLPPSPRVALLTISGGVGVQMADAAVEAGLDVAPMSDEAQTRLKRDLPFAAPRNPVDVTAQAFNDIRLIGSNLDLILDDGRYDSVVAFFTYVAAADAMVEPIRRTLERARARHPDTIIMLSLVGPPHVVQAYEEVGCPVFEDPTRAVRAVAALHRFHLAFETRRPRPDVPTPPTERLPDRVSEHDAKRILSTAGLSIPDERLVTSADAAVETAAELGGPVVLKIVSAEIPHKTEIGGVLLGLDTPEAIRAGFDTLMSRGRAVDGAVIDGVLVSQRLEPGVETILGVHRDPTFGPVVMVGLGGIFVEVLEDVSFRVAPFDELEARRMIEELKGYSVLTGARTGKVCAIDALAEVLARLSIFAATHADDVESVEVNPFLVLPEGRGGVALDALIVPRKKEEGRAID